MTDDVMLLGFDDWTFDDAEPDAGYQISLDEYEEIISQTTAESCFSLVSSSLDNAGDDMMCVELVAAFFVVIAMRCVRLLLTSM